MNSNSLGTVVTTLAIIVMSLFLITAMQRSHAIYVGVVLVVCILTFAVVLSIDDNKKKRKGFIKL